MPRGEVVGLLGAGTCTASRFILTKVELSLQTAARSHTEIGNG
jgi:hypothetical protein